MALTREPSAVRIDIDNATLRLALSYVADRAGWAVTNHPVSGLVVSNEVCRATPDLPIAVLVVSDRPADCRAALDALTEGRVTTILRAEDPEQLPRTLDAACRGFALVPTEVICAARGAPRLTERLQATLRLVAAGSSNPTIAKALNESESTAKRDVSELMRLLGVRSRYALTDVATRVGYYRPWATAAAS